MSRKFFQIGFNKCGTTFIERLFRLNGIPSQHWAKGALAEDIAYSSLTGRAPLQKWAADTVAFTDMESVRFLNLPIIEAFRDFAFLDRSFPGAVFLLNTRNVDDWISSRYRHMEGRYARAHALARGVGLTDLADIWRADWHDHLAAARAHFGNRAEFIQIDIDEAQPDDYRRALAPFFDLPRVPDLPGSGRLKTRQGYASQIAEMLAAPQPGEDVPQLEREAVAASLARFARPARVQADTSKAQPNQRVVRFDAATGEICDMQGAVLPIRRGEGGRHFIDPARAGMPLIASVANDIAGVTDRGLYHLDLREGGVAGAAIPVIAPARREGAANVFLWPLPRHHRLANGAFMGPDPSVFTPLDQRADRAIWVGSEPSAAWQGIDGVDLRPDAGGDHLHSHRFVICPGGQAIVPDFLPALNAGAVVMKEEDRWQVYHSGLFRPWEHFIPLEPGAGDLRRQLDWARDNPRACQRMVDAARRMCRALADPAGRRRHLALVLADYRAATGQD